MPWQRPDKRKYNELRPVRFDLDFIGTAAASVLIRTGNTKVLCTVTIQPVVPKFLVDTGKGWLTAEYRMLPTATIPRQQREFLRLSGRTQEIQRLIGRSLRASIDLEAIGEKTINIDTDVLQADAGTRTASITGSYVALVMAINDLVKKGELKKSPLLAPVAAVSVGLIKGEPFLDLNYTEDQVADVDFNIVMNTKGELVEVQGTAEGNCFLRSQLDAMLDLADEGIKVLLDKQQQALSGRLS